MTKAPSFPTVAQLSTAARSSKMARSFPRAAAKHTSVTAKLMLATPAVGETFVGEVTDGGEPPISEYVGGEYVDGVCGDGSCPACPGGAKVFVDGSFVGPSDEYLCDGGDFDRPPASAPTGPSTASTGRRHRPLRHARRPRHRHAQQPRLHLLRRGSPRSAALLTSWPRAAGVRQSGASKSCRRPRPTKRSRSYRSLQRTASRSISASSRPACSASASRPAGSKTCRPRWTCSTRSRRTRTCRSSARAIVDNAEKPWLALRDRVGHRTDRRAGGAGRVRRQGGRTPGRRQAGRRHLPDRRPDNPRLRLIKLASCGHAQPGEEIEFTLRFDNIGDQTIGNVTIVDNLTTRLEYVPELGQEQRRRRLHHRAERRRLARSSAGKSSRPSKPAKAACCGSASGCGN